MLGGARSGKSRFAERLAADVGEKVLYVATAVEGDDGELVRRVRAHRERRPATWGTLEVGGGPLDAVLEEAGRWDAVLLDSLTLWVSARLGEPEEETLTELRGFLDGAGRVATPCVVVSDEVGMGVVPASAEGRAFRDLLGLANQEGAAGAAEVYLCVAGVGMRVK